MQEPFADPNILLALIGSQILADKHRHENHDRPGNDQRGNRSTNRLKGSLFPPVVERVGELNVDVLKEQG